jgi:hypothetical protein
MKKAWKVFAVLTGDSSERDEEGERTILRFFFSFSIPIQSNPIHDELNFMVFQNLMQPLWCDILPSVPFFSNKFQWLITQNPLLLSLQFLSPTLPRSTSKLVLPNKFSAGFVSKLMVISIFQFSFLGYHKLFYFDNQRLE